MAYSLPLKNWSIPDPQPPRKRITRDLLWDWLQSGSISKENFQRGMVAIHTEADLEKEYIELAKDVDWIKYETWLRSSAADANTPTLERNGK